VIKKLDHRLTAYLAEAIDAMGELRPSRYFFASNAAHGR